MEINPETVLDALNDFERKPLEISPVLEDYLQRVAQNGEIIFPWCKMKPLLKRKLEIVLDEFYESCPVEISVPVPNFETFNYDTLKKTILSAVEAFTSAPFTIQRICELITNPKKHYNRTDKYMRGIEKNVLVVSTIEPRIGGQSDGNANVNPVVNGMIGDSPHEDNDCFNGHENNENEPPNNLNTPDNHVLLDNFANVFPLAACIPSPSNICIKQEVDSANSDSELDSNFNATSDCADSTDVEFSPQINMDTTEPSETKDEDMDTDDTTVEEEPISTFADASVMLEPETEAKVQPISDENEVLQPVSERLEEEITEKEEVMSSEVSDTTSITAEDTDSMQTVSESNIKNEAECSVKAEKWIPPELDRDTVDTPESTKSIETVECQQDDTVSSQSEETMNESSSEISQSDDAVADSEASADGNDMSANEACVSENSSVNEVSVSETSSPNKDSVSENSSDEVIISENSSGNETSLIANEASSNENDDSSSNEASTNDNEVLLANKEDKDSSVESDNTEVSQSIDDDSEQTLANQNLRKFRISNSESKE